MKFQHKLVAITALLCGFGAVYPAAGKLIAQMNPKEIGALNFNKLSGEERVQVLFTALFSGLEHQRSAARGLLQKNGFKNFDAFRKDLVDAGLDPLIKTIQNEVERAKIKKAYLQGLFSGLEHSRKAARDVVNKYVANKGLSPIDWKKLADQVKRDGLETLFAVRSVQNSGQGSSSQGSSQQGSSQGAQVGVQVTRTPDGQIIIALSQAIAQATGKQNVTLDLNNNETFTATSFRELINDATGKKDFVVALSQDANNTWFSHVYDAGEFETYTRTPQGDRDPNTRAEIKHTVPVSISKQDIGS